MLTQAALPRFAALGDEFFTELTATGMPAPFWVAQSADCAALLGLVDDWADPPTLAVLSGNAPWPAGPSRASVYSGHQFGQWAGQLGDGRALLLGDIATPAGLMEVQLKGAGLTPYSRMGDGRAVLRSSIREFLCSEAFAALNIPTTRALCITGSGLPVRRETLETAAVVTRVAPSFIRFGHFEHFAHTNQHAALRELADFFIAEYAPECLEADNAYVALLQKVARQTAQLMADWQAVGFCHGVMNTDNMSMLGLTLDYGPFGFMDGFDPGHVCNHSDHQGRYAYNRQPNVGFWNLHALAQAFMPLVGDGDALLAALGLGTVHDADKLLIDDWLKLMAAARADFTISFRRLSRFSEAPDAVRDLFMDRAAFDAWALRYQHRLAADERIDAERQQAMLAVNPAVVLRNHLAEGAIRQAQAGDFSETTRLLKVLQRPYDEPMLASDAALPPDWAQTLEVSCSS